MIKIIALNGSPNKNKTTARLLTAFLDCCKQMGAETELIHAASIVMEQKQPFCIACMPNCNGRCIKGTQLDEAYQRLAMADGVLIGTPVYYSSLSAQTKAFFDKSRVYRTQNAFVNLVGAVLATGGARYGGQENTAQTLHAMMLVHGMTVIGDGHMEHDPGHHALYGGPGALTDDELRTRLFILAQRMVELCKKVERAKINLAPAKATGI